MDPLLQAIALATANVRGGGEPFGAVVVTKNGTRYTGVNSVEAESDPTAHAEILALRAAAKVEGPVLSGAALYASGEPCPMCLATALWAGVDRLIYAASREDAGKYGLDSTPLYEQVAGGTATVVDVAVERRDVEERLEPFELWAGALGS